ncbi:ATP-binding cassette domain-containing protein [Xanthovirga aplysinae]|uniref:ATP-binding cassette domain-containing protein n=1 Tax=Xanthovirga aplysinae TaxID=2529853 RepID=UPI0012BBE31B|nr:ATP-binding cassette domain-containing protein [Xanthovirga aplysinae]MTI32385.1 ABC transporter ATP-binding protein [Xanthovirga aplysinae]
MLSVKDLVVTFGQNRVLNELSLQLENKKVYGLIGFNGAGKTTLLKAIQGIVSKEKGEIHWNNRKLQRKDLAYLETQNFFYSHITGREYLSLFPAPDSSFKIDLWQELFKLPLDEFVEDYSTGMKKKLALLGILKMDKSLIFLDEPYNGVDLETSRILGILIEKLKEKGKTILITSHILETLTNNCDHILYLEEGKIQKTFDKNQLENLDKEIFHLMEANSTQLINKVLK